MVSYTLLDDFQLWRWDIKGPDFEAFNQGPHALPQDWLLPFRKEIPRKNCDTGHMAGWWRDEVDVAVTCDEIALCRSVSILRYYAQVWLSCLSDKRICWVVNVCSHKKYQDRQLPPVIAGMPVHIWSDDLTIERPPGLLAGEKDRTLDPHQFQDDAVVASILEAFPRAVGLRIMLTGCCEILYSSTADTLWAAWRYRAQSKQLLHRFFGVRQTTLRTNDRILTPNVLKCHGKRQYCKNGNLGVKVQFSDDTKQTYWVATGIPASKVGSARASCFAVGARARRTVGDPVWVAGESKDQFLGTVDADLSHEFALERRLVLVKSKSSADTLRMVTPFLDKFPLQSRFADPQELLQDPICVTSGMLAVKDFEDPSLERYARNTAWSSYYSPDYPQARWKCLEEERELYPNPGTVDYEAYGDRSILEGVQYVKKQGTSGSFERSLLWRVAAAFDPLCIENLLCRLSRAEKQTSVAVLRTFSVTFSTKRWSSMKKGKFRPDHYAYSPKPNEWYLHGGPLLPPDLQDARILCSDADADVKAAAAWAKAHRANWQ